MEKIIKINKDVFINYYFDLITAFIVFLLCGILGFKSDLQVIFWVIFISGFYAGSLRYFITNYKF